MANEVLSPFPMFYDTDGTPLEGGYVYIGVYGLNPLSNPQQAYWDSALAIPAANIRTSGGFIVHDGAPSKLWVFNDYSLLVTDKNGSIVYSELSPRLINEDFYLTLPRSVFNRAMRIPSSYNFNQILESGWYAWSDASTVNNPPGSTATDLFVLEVLASPEGSIVIVQKVVNTDLGPSDFDYAYIRQSVDGGATWSSWVLPGNRSTVPLLIVNNAVLTVNRLHIIEPNVQSPPVALSLPAAVIGDTIDIICRGTCNLFQTDSEEVISWYQSLFTTKGVGAFLPMVGALKLFAGDRLRLTYRGTGWAKQAPTKIADPAAFPTGSAYGSVFSPDGRYSAVSHATSPYVTIYDWSSGAPVKIANPASLPTGTSYYTPSWSPDGRYLVIAHNTTPFITIYDWSSGSPVKIADPAALPAGNAYASAWSPDGRFLAVAHSTTPFVTIYDWATGVPVKITNPVSLPAGDAQGAAWSPDGRFLALALITTPFLAVYDMISTVPLKLANPVTIPTTAGGPACSFSPDGRFLCMGSSGSPFIIIYDMVTGAPVKIPDPTSLPGAQAQSAAWSPDGRFLVVGHLGGVNVTIYDWLTGGPVKITNPVLTPPNNGLGAAWSPDGRYLIVTSSGANYITIYDTRVAASKEWLLDFEAPGLKKVPANVLLPNRMK